MGLITYAQHHYVPEVAELFVLCLFGLFFKVLIKGECVFKKSLSAGLLQATKKQTSWAQDEGCSLS